MGLAPRFRPGASRRPFVNREEILAAFDLAYRDGGAGPRVLNLTGVGGIGKSRLLVELRGRLPKEAPTGVLDLQVPAQREPQDALAVLREGFARGGARFHRFDIAYAVMWQRLHPRLALGSEGRAIVRNSEVLTDLLGDASGVPVFGTAARLLDAAARRVWRWQQLRGDATLRELDKLPLPQLLDAVTYLFAGDLRETAPAAPVLFVDAYEALIGGAPRAGRTASVDAWLRDLVVQVDRGLVVVASREPLGWQRYDPAWTGLLQTVPVEGLPPTASLELLDAMGVSDRRLAESIARGSAGVPFYLHLAYDTGAAGGSVVSPEAILERFLLHVEPDDVRMLELLSVARLFDEETFKAVATAHGLPGHRLAWESLAGYSFVLPAGAGALRLHQLMRVAARQRLSQGSLADLHRVLRAVWHERAGATTNPAVALREAAYHAFRSGEREPHALLDYADRVRASAAAAGLEGMIADLEEYLAETPAPGLEQLATYLQAEAALLHGDAAGAAALTAAVRVHAPEGEVEARLAVAAAHARRILGHTADAFRRYDTVWRGHRGSAQLIAGLWVGDLHMAQGRFVEAVEAATEVDRLLPKDRHEERGSLQRLLHLAHRFVYDLPRAAEHLERARRSYEAAGSSAGLADVRTNLAELLALTDPAAAVAIAHDAIRLQREIGADHELGKAFSALGLAHTALGELDAAEYALTEAVAALERAAYRSGRARAELYRAVLLVRRGQPDEAVVAVRWASEEFEAAEVYPTLIVAAVRLAERIGRPDPALDAVAARALARLHLPPTAPDLDRRLGDVLGRLLDDGLAAVHRAAKKERGGPFAGFYHHNVRFGGDLVRIPIPGTDTMDLAIWPEHLVLAAVGRHIRSVPRLHAVSADPAFQVHEFVEGDVVDAIAPRGTPVPTGLVDQAAGFLAGLAQVPATDLPPPPVGWPGDGDVVGFAQRLSAVTASVHSRHRDRFLGLWRRLGFPNDPLAVVDWSALTPRPFALVHADVHRKNMIRTHAGRIVIIDWEFALWGDPVYDLATHLHKMAYLPEEQADLLRRWEALQPARARDGWWLDLACYLRHERVKSAVVDSIRYAKLVADPALPPARTAALAATLAAKVAAARQVWGDDRPVDTDQVRAALLAAASTLPSSPT